MKRRKFMIASGSAILSGALGLSQSQRSAVGIDFELSNIPDKDPKDAESLIVDFKKLEVTPQNLDDSEDMRVIAEIEMGGKTDKLELDSLSVTNGETEQLADRIGVLVVDNIADEDGIFGTVSVTVDHPDIQDKYSSQIRIPSSNIPDSGVARWTLDNADTDGNTAVDKWSSREGTINEATTGVSGANQTYTTNEAYSFNSSESVSLPNLGSSVSGSSSRTVSYWIYHEDDNNGYGVSYGDESSTGGKFASNTYPTRNQVKLRCHFLDMSWPVVIDKQTWYHICWTYDGSNVGDLDTEQDGISLYVDGSHISNGSFDRGNSSGSLTTTDTNYSIGYLIADNGYMNGRVDDVRFYDKQISSTEVSNLYQTGRISG